MVMERIYGTIEENMETALREDDFIKRYPRDPYTLMAKKNVEYYLNCAAALERGEREIESRFPWAKEIQNA